MSYQTSGGPKFSTQKVDWGARCLRYREHLVALARQLTSSAITLRAKAVPKSQPSPDKRRLRSAECRHETSTLENCFAFAKWSKVRCIQMKSVSYVWTNVCRSLRSLIIRSGDPRKIAGIGEKVFNGSSRFVVKQFDHCLTFTPVIREKVRSLNSEFVTPRLANVKRLMALDLRPPPRQYYSKTSTGQVQGPIKEATVTNLIREGAITSKTCLSSHPKGPWVPASRDAIFGSYFDGPVSLSLRPRLEHLWLK